MTDKLKYIYEAFGLLISSELKFEEMMEVEDQDRDVDVVIELGIVPDELEGSDVVKKVFNQSKKDAYLLIRPDIAKYYVTHGKKVVIDIYKGANVQSVRLFFLSSVMAAVLHQKRKIPLHASAVKLKDQLILFIGNSGVGKSTSVAHLHSRGYDLFSDDVCVLDSIVKDSKIKAYSSYPMSRLWKDAIDQLDSEHFTAAQKVRIEINKYANYFWDTYDTQSQEISLIVHLENTKFGPSRMLDLTVGQKMSTLGEHTFRKGQMDGLGGRKEHFLFLSQVVRAIPMIRVLRDTTIKDPDPFINLLENVIKKYN